MTKNFEEEWNGMAVEEKNVIVSSYLKTLSKWNFKRILCDVLGKFIEEILVDPSDDIAAHFIQCAVIENTQQFPSSSSENMV